MKCPQCETENPLGVQYCVGCGHRLELTDAEAQVQAVAAVKKDSWQEAFKTMNKTLYFFLLVLVASLLFSGYARRGVMADYSPDTPLPPAPEIQMSHAFIDLPGLPIPPRPGLVAFKADAEPGSIVDEFAQSAHNGRACTLYLRGFGNAPQRVTGTLLRRTEDHFYLVEKDGWKKPLKVRRIPRTKLHPDRRKDNVLPEAPPK
ncbi:MAG: zinc ribbon domain-containing protein [Planctomycetota bacterium]